MKLFAIIFTVFPLVFVGVGSYLAWSQHHKIVTYQPARAVVLSGRVERHESTDSDGHRSTSYKPIVEYRYEWNGRPYTCKQVTPVDESAGSDWAHDIVRRYPVGQACEAYCNPADPADAFLVKRHSFFPYFFVLFPMLFVTIGVTVGCASGASTRKPPEPQPEPDGWFALRATSRIADRRRTALIVAVVWNGIGVLAWGHYFSVAEPPYETFAIVATAVYQAVGCVPIVFAVYYHVLGRRLGDAGVWVGAQRFAIGDEIALYAEQPVYVPVRVQELTVGLVCERTTRERRGSKTTISTNACYERRESVLTDHSAQPGEVLRTEQTLSIPPDEPPSTPPDCREYPRYAWHIEFKTRVDNSPDYRAKFPLLIQARS